MKNTLINFYNTVSFSHNYIFGYILKGMVYMTFTTNEVIESITKIEKASTATDGYSLRFKPNNEQKNKLKKDNAICLCSEEDFKNLVASNKYNRGENFEKLVTEYFGMIWEKDNNKFYQSADITIKNIAYQIKFEKASFISEGQMTRIKKELGIAND